jgi:hypothetical protein
MQRSSESIGTIAAALAKTQAQLVNPERSLLATIRSDGPRGTEQTFRYAPLSFIRLCNLPNYALDRLSRYEATLWRQTGQILFALDNSDRRKPHEKMRRSSWR